MSAKWRGSDQIFWSEIKHERSTKRSVQVCYAMLLADHHADGDAFWRTINRAVARRFKMKRESELVHFQECARAIYSDAAHVAVPTTNEEFRNVARSG